MEKRFLLSLMMSLVALTAFCAELVEYHPVNSHFIQLRYSDISITVADDPSTYTITSSDDSNYSTGIYPSDVGRKSKQWHGEVNHWIYLELPHALDPGKTYTITYPELISNGSVTFKFEEQSIESASIHLNHIGFNPDASSKYAYVYHWMGTLGAADMSSYEGNTFRVLDTVNGQEVFTGSMKFRKARETSNARDSKGQVMPEGLYGSAVWECDFSSLNMEGAYRLVIDGIGCSQVFRVDREVYRDLLKLTARGLYHYRSGPERTMDHTAWIKPEDHIPGITNGGAFSIIYSNRKYSDGKNAFNDLPAQATTWEMPGNQQSWMNDEWGIGGYFDAGDYDRNWNHFRISRYLLQVFEMAPGGFFDGAFNIPESGNGIPDLLDEARWVIDFYRNLSGPTGGVCGGLETTGHNGSPSWDEERYDQWYAYAEEAAPTYMLAGSEAHLAHCLSLIGKTAELDTLEIAARAHYTWAVSANPNHDERAYAAAALFKLTGDTNYLDDYIAHTEINTPNSGGGLTQKYATWMYLTTNRSNMDFGLKSIQKQAALKWANDEGFSNVADNAMRVIRNNNDRLWLGESSTPDMISVIVAHYLTGDPDMLNYLYTTSDYYNGGNPLNITWIAGAEEIGADKVTQEVLASDTKAIKALVPGLSGSIPGTIVYGISINTAWTGTNAAQQNTLYPSSAFGQPVNWPAHEVYFDNGRCVETNEFTVHQTMGPATATYAYLSLFEDVSGIQVEAVMLDRDSIDIPETLSSSVVVRLVPFNASSSALTWTSNDPAIASVDENGVITGVSTGETFVTVRGNSGDADTLRVTVLPFFELSGIEILKRDSEIIRDTFFLEPNMKLNLEAGFEPENASVKDITWSTSDPSVFNLDEFGTGQSYRLGSAMVILAGHNDVADTIHVIVRSSAAIPGKIETEYYFECLDSDTGGRIRTEDNQFDGTEYLGWLGVGDWAKYSYSVLEEGRYRVIANVAGTQSSGEFELNIGSQKLTYAPAATGGWVTWENQEIDGTLDIMTDDTVLTLKIENSGYNINYLLFEKAPDPVYLESVAFSLDTVFMEINEEEELTLRYFPEDAENKSGIWTSSAPDIADVDQSGLVSAHAAGLATVSFVSNQNPSIFDEVIVKVADETTDLFSLSAYESLNIFPNPIRNQTICLSGHIPGGSVATVYSASGIQLFQQTTTGDNERIYLPTRLSSGLYLLHLANQNTRTKTTLKFTIATN